MSDNPDDRLDPAEYGEVPEESEQLDQDQFQPDDALTGRDLDDALDEGLATPERWSAAEREKEHETIAQRLDEEIPDDDGPDDDAVPGEDVGIDAAAAGAEEAAVHVVDEDDDRQGLA